jgi:signal transduction histidine kinase
VAVAEYLAADHVPPAVHRHRHDLHDGAQQRLVSLAMNLGMARARFTDVPEPELRAIADAHDAALMALSEVREFIRGLHPAVLNDRGLDAALSGLAARAPRPVRLSVDAQATQAEVTVARNGDLLRIAVTDNGTGGPTVIAAELQCAS